MTKKNFAFLLLISVALVSCHADQDCEFVVSNNPTLEDLIDKNNISVDEAIVSLYSEMGYIYGEETRVKSIKDVTCVKLHELLGDTRGTENNIDNLLYIVEFENGQGSAILGADKRIDSVVAILDESSITKDDFVRAMSGVEDGNISTYIAKCISNSIANTLNTETRSGIIQRPTSNWVENDTINIRKQNPILNTKWHQRAPYNSYCITQNFDGSNVVCVAGCVPIAAAQTIAHNMFPTNLIINGISFDWSLIDDCYYGATPSLAAKDEVARFVHEIGLNINAVYGENSTSASTHNVVGLLNEIGYSNVAYVDYDYNDVFDMVYTNKYPTIIKGNDVDDNSGHAWVIDGCFNFTVNSYLCSIPANSINVTRTYIGSSTTRKVHCNFGWNGYCDGYYSDGVFNTNVARGANDIVGEIGDKSSTTDYNYSQLNYIITYEL